MSNRSKRSPAPDVAREELRAGTEDGVVTLSTGFRARLVPVAATLIEEVTNRIEEPPVPMWHNPQKDRDEPNPAHPEYIAALKKMGHRRGQAAIDAMVMFGVQLVDGLPADDKWLEQLRFLERRGHLDLGSYDLEDELDREFVFKRYVAVASEDLALLSSKSGISPQEVERAAATFQRKTQRRADTGGEAPPPG